MIKWGIIGLGKMAQTFANSIKETSNAKLISVASLDKNRLKLFKDNFNISDDNAHNNYDDLISSKKVDAIYIANLNNAHLSIIKKSADQNKNILCEKPITTNYEEAKEAYEHIKKNNIIFYEAIAYISHPQTKIVKEIIDKKEIGNIVSIEASFGFRVRKIKPESRLFNKKVGGGSILDIGSYPISFLNFLFNDIDTHQLNDAKGSFTSTGVDEYAEAKVLINNTINCYIKVSIREKDRKSVV